MSSLCPSRVRPLLLPPLVDLLPSMLPPKSALPSLSSDPPTLAYLRILDPGSPPPGAFGDGHDDQGATKDYSYDNDA